MANTITKLHEELSGKSFLYNNNHIFTCDISDAITVENGVIKANKIYLNSKADFLIHPYSKCSNSITKFNNDKPLYKQNPAPRIPNNSTTSHNETQTQKIIQNQVRAPASLYTMNLGSLHINSNNLHPSTTNKAWHNASDRLESHNKGVDIKHNSYARYLGKKKSQYLKTQPVQTPAPKPLWGNKTRNFGLINCTKTC